MMPLVAELTVPALFVAGATTSLHCVLMCGAINVAQVRSRGPVPLHQALSLVHAGRVLGYALLGLLAGTLGARLALWLPDTMSGRAVQALAGLALVAAGVQQLGGGRRRAGEKGGGPIFPTRGRPCHAAWTKMDPAPFLPHRARLLAQGLAWALVPCGILYTVVLLAALSASPLAGVLLLAAFGLGTVPVLGVSGGLLGVAARGLDSRRLSHAAGAALVTLGLAAVLLAALLPDGFADLFCLR